MSGDVPSVDKVPDRAKVWFQHGGSWYPGVLEAWSRERRVAHCWVKYVKPIGGQPGGWYSSAYLEHGMCPDDPDVIWDAAAARLMDADRSVLDDR